MSRHVTDYGYDTVLALHEEAQNSELLSPKDILGSHFFKLPRAKRGKSFGYYLNYLYLNVLSIYELVRCIRKEHVSVIHVNEILDLYAVLAAKIVGIPCVLHVRADLAAAPKLRWLLPRLIRVFCDCLIVVSDSVKKRLFVGQGISTRKVKVIYDPGPDPKQFHPYVDGSKVRHEFGVNGGEFVVTLVAKLVKMKGHEMLIRSAPIVLRDFPNTRFLLVGGEVGGRHQDYADRLHDLVDELGIRNKVTFAGFRSDVPEIMAASDIVTHCSTYPDPFPGTVLQGMAMGKPVVAPRLGGPIEQIENNVSGILVNPDDSEALAKAIICLLSDSAQRDRIGKAAAARIKEKFSANAFFGELTNTYGELIDSR
jgi:glycosyltransferase involved in cell wall biosynthesis